MEYTMTVCVSPSEMFNYLEDVLLNYIYEKKGVYVDSKKLCAGYSVQVKENERKVKITLLEYKKPFVYYVETKSEKDTTTTRYVFEECKRGTKITFEEIIRNEHGVDVTPSGILFGVQRKNQFKNRMRAIETMIINR